MRSYLTVRNIMTALFETQKDKDSAVYVIPDDANYEIDDLYKSNWEVEDYIKYVKDCLAQHKLPAQYYENYEGDEEDEEDEDFDPNDNIDYDSIFAETINIVTDENNPYYNKCFLLRLWEEDYVNIILPDFTLLIDYDSPDWGYGFEYSFDYNLHENKNTSGMILYYGANTNGYYFWNAAHPEKSILFDPVKVKVADTNNYKLAELIYDGNYIAIALNGKYTVVDKEYKPLFKNFQYDYISYWGDNEWNRNLGHIFFLINGDKRTIFNADTESILLDKWWDDVDIYKHNDNVCYVVKDLNGDSNIIKDGKYVFDEPKKDIRVIHDGKSLAITESNGRTTVYDYDLNPKFEGKFSNVQRPDVPYNTDKIFQFPIAYKVFNRSGKWTWASETGEKYSPYFFDGFKRVFYDGTEYTNADLNAKPTYKYSNYQTIKIDPPSIDDTYIVASYDDKKYILDKEDRHIISSPFDKFVAKSIIEANGKYAFLDKNGECIMDCWYDDVNLDIPEAALITCSGKQNLFLYDKCQLLYPKWFDEVYVNEYRPDVKNRSTYNAPEFIKSYFGYEKTPTEDDYWVKVRINDKVYFINAKTHKFKSKKGLPLGNYRIDGKDIITTDAKGKLLYANSKIGFDDVGEFEFFDGKYALGKVTSIRDYDKYNLVDRDGNVLLDAFYTNIEPICNGQLVACNNRYWNNADDYKIYDKNGNRVLEDIEIIHLSKFYDYLEIAQKYHDDYSLIKYNGKDFEFVTPVVHFIDTYREKNPEWVRLVKEDKPGSVYLYDLKKRKYVAGPYNDIEKIKKENGKFTFMATYDDYDHPLNAYKRKFFEVTVDDD